MGCGPGADTLALADYAGTSGSVTGIDIDEVMFAAADQAAGENRKQGVITHIKGDVTALPFPDNAFEASRAARLFQVLPKSIPPLSVFTEMVRVTKSKGSIVIADTDWATATVDFSDSFFER